MLADCVTDWLEICIAVPEPVMVRIIPVCSGRETLEWPSATGGSVGDAAYPGTTTASAMTSESAAPSNASLFMFLR